MLCRGAAESVGVSLGQSCCLLHVLLELMAIDKFVVGSSCKSVVPRTLFWTGRNVWPVNRLSPGRRQTHFAALDIQRKDKSLMEHGIVALSTCCFSIYHMIFYCTHVNLSEQH